MQIQSINIHAFAGLKNYELSFSPGLNSFYGPNERGKTTVLQFIFGMFYGLGDRRGKYNLRDRVSPRDGSSMGGSIRFAFADHNYELLRNFGERSALDRVELFDLTEHKTIELDNPDQPGASLFGISEEVFRNSVLIDADGPEIEDSDNLSNAMWEKLTDFMVSADADVSVNTVEKRLEDAKYELKSRSGRKGVLQDLEAEIQALDIEKANRDRILREQDEKLKQLSADEDMLAELREEREELNIRARLLDYAEDKQTLRMMEKPQETLANLRAEHASFGKRLEFIGGNTKAVESELEAVETDLRYYENEKSNLAEALKDFGNKQESEAKETAKQHSLNLILAFVGIIVMVLVFSFLEREVGVVVSLVIIAILVVYLYLRQRNFTLRSEVIQGKVDELDKREKALEKSKQQLLRDLNKLEIYSSLDLDDYSAIYKRINQYWEQIQDLKFLERQIQHTEASINNADYNKEDVQRLRENLATEASYLSDAGYDLNEIKFDYAAQKNLAQEIANVNGEIDTFEDIISNNKGSLSYLLVNPYTGEMESAFEQSSLIAQKLEEKEADLQEAKLDYAASELAGAIFAESLLDFRKTLLPKLNVRAGQYIEQTSNGRYSDVQISDGLFIKLKDNYYGMSLEPAQLSSGTRDQVWLAYRLALADYLGANSSYPLLLDDTFVYFDDNRFKSSIEMIEKWSEAGSRQVIFFTCHKHSQEILEAKGNWETKTLPKNRG